MGDESELKKYKRGNIDGKIEAGDLILASLVIAIGIGIQFKTTEDDILTKYMVNTLWCQLSLKMRMINDPHKWVLLGMAQVLLTKY